MTATTAPPRHIVLTGATGQIGSLMVRHLAPHHRLTLTSRTPRRTLRWPGIRHLACHYDDMASIVNAFRGADALFVVTNDPTRPEHDRNIVRAAVEVSAGHIVKLSAAAVRDSAAHDLITEWQRTNEDRIKSSGIPWTMIQPRSFMSHALAWAPSIRNSGTTHALHPHSRNACIAPEDVAEVSHGFWATPGTTPTPTKSPVRRRCPPTNSRQSWPKCSGVPSPAGSCPMKRPTSPTHGGTHP